MKIILFLCYIIILINKLQCINDENEENSSINMTNKLDFIIEGPDVIQLPVDDAVLKVVFNSTEENIENENLTYYWTTLDGIGNSYADEYDRQILKLTKLKPGKFRFQVTVTNNYNVSIHKEKELIVKEAEKIHQKPVAIIKPPGPVIIIENSQLVLDGEGSKSGDNRIVTYEWKLKKGPSIQLPTNLNTPILTLNNLSPNNYTFSLKVINDISEYDETEINVTVLEERDDPPKAKISRCGDTATGSITIRLPLEKLYLCGNGSTDDKNVTEYRWIRKDIGLAVDFVGSSQPILTLTDLHPNEDIGPYIFELEVSDIKGQNDSATINIFVNKPENQPPKVNAGSDTIITLPETSVILDGTVEDDGTIVSYKWSQIQGPLESAILNSDNPKATATNLQEGEYVFEFTAIDDGDLNASSIVHIKVQRTKNDPPIAKAKNVTIYLPKSIVALNGSSSIDDAGIVEYRWIPFDNVPACISALDNSDNKSILLLSGLVQGEFYYNFTVFDQQRLSNSTIVKLTVLNSEKQLNSIEIYIKQKIENITYKLRRKLLKRLEAALASQIPEATVFYVHFIEFGQDPKTGNLRVVFYAQYSKEIPESNRDVRSSEIELNLPVLKAEEAVVILKKETAMIEDFNIIQIDSLYCQKTCSNHGKCNDFTKECECETYWMGNIFTQLSTGKQLDCSWSKLYFYIMLTSMLTVIMLGSACSITMRRKFRKCWLCKTCWNSAKDQFKNRRYRRKRRYEPLNQDGTTAMIQMSSSSLHSDSDDSLFQSKNLRGR